MSLVRPPRCRILAPVWPKASHYPRHTPGKIAHTGVGSIHQPLQSLQRAVGAAEQPACLHRSLQERTDGNTFENNPVMSSLSLGQTHNIFDIIKENVQVRLPLTELTSKCALISLNVNRPCPKKKNASFIAVSGGKNSVKG